MSWVEDDLALLAQNHARLLRRNARLDAIVEAIKSVASEPEVHSLLTCYVMGIELLNRLEALDGLETL